MCRLWQGVGEFTDGVVSVLALSMQPERRARRIVESPDHARQDAQDGGASHSVYGTEELTLRPRSSTP